MNERVRVLSAIGLIGALGQACDGNQTEGLVPEVGTSARSIVTDCDYLNPALFPPLPTPVDYNRELVIRHLSVVEDPCRTTNFPAAACPAGTVGVWTLGELMRRMAGAFPVDRFVAEWVRTFEVGTVINGFPVPPRPNVRPNFIDPWLVASGCPAGAPLVGAGSCPLDVARAPFRLLAIVNRVDIADAGFGATEPGEARFVFGMLDAISGAPLQGTVILEYKLPPPKNAFDWENTWHLLSGLPLGSVAYRNQLQNLLNQITMPGVMPGAPNNGAAIGQIRTNDIDLGFVWELREYTLQDVGRGPNRFGLRNHEMHLTPDDSLNFTVALDNYLVANEPAILTVSHTVPSTMLGGRSTAPFVWNNGGTAGPITADARHLFGFSTCNGCHFDETATPFVHIAPRNAGAPAALSPFLAQTTASGGAGLPAGFQNVLDPAGTGIVFRYNEPWRRVCEATRILNGDPTPYTASNGAH